MKSQAVLSAAMLCVVLAPAAAAADSFTPSQKDQLKLGKQAAGELRKKEKILPSTSPKVKLVRRIGQRLLSSFTEKAPWEFSFDVIDSKEINAFALPGGPMFVYTGLLDKLKTEDELAGILGHELTHVRREHWARHVAEAQKRNLLLGGLLIAAHANHAIENVVSVGNSLYDLKYSRGDETQADDGGYAMMTGAGFNPQGMVDVFELLNKTAKGDKAPEFLSDHPSDKNRIKRMKDRIIKEQADGKEYPAQRPLKLD